MGKATITVDDMSPQIKYTGNWIRSRELLSFVSKRLWSSVLYLRRSCRVGREGEGWVRRSGATPRVELELTTLPFPLLPLSLARRSESVATRSSYFHNTIIGTTALGNTATFDFNGTSSVRPLPPPAQDELDPSRPPPTDPACRLALSGVIASLSMVRRRTTMERIRSRSMGTLRSRRVERWGPPSSRSSCSERTT